VTDKTNEGVDATHWSSIEEAVELLHEERFADAMVELRQALQIDPKNPYAYYFLGIAFFESGEVEAARDAYSACLKVAPAHLGARIALCHVLRMLGDVPGALRQGMAALSQSPGDPDALHAVGLAYHARGDDAATKKYLEAFLATGPELEVALETRAVLARTPGTGAPQGDGEQDDEN
jgi:tetratricopeptide (TPR) repeat protein